uniref:HTH psq-type domain-containing protein n=1 Tax=Romanomermis culicivorax TaxID=13658 RepID=A0A915JX98_ROMCU
MVAETTQYKIKKRPELSIFMWKMSTREDRLFFLTKLKPSVTTHKTILKKIVKLTLVLAYFLAFVNNSPYLTSLAFFQQRLPTLPESSDSLVLWLTRLVRCALTAVISIQLLSWCITINPKKYSASVLADAVQCTKDGMPLREASMAFNIPKSTLANKAKKKHQESVEKPTVFSKEHAIVDAVLTLAEWGFH